MCSLYHYYCQCTVGVHGYLYFDLQILHEYRPERNWAASYYIEAHRRQASHPSALGHYARQTHATDM